MPISPSSLARTLVLLGKPFPFPPPTLSVRLLPRESFNTNCLSALFRDASDAPESFNTSAPVVIKLGYDDGGPGGLHEHWDLVKASDHVPLSSGHADVALPDSLEARDDYIVVVMGDSGNASPKFSVTAKSAAKRIVYNPTITSPSGGESFAAGSKTTLTWSLDGLPEQLKDSHVEVRLGYAPSENDEGYHEKWSLGQFPITDGKAHVTLPSDLNPREDYLFVLLGDSGNFSKQFKVTTA